jgi:hypothetical protein
MLLRRSSIIETDPVRKLEELERRLKRAKRGFRRTKYQIYQENNAERGQNEVRPRGFKSVC